MEVLTGILESLLARPWLATLVGLVFLFFGRRLYWLVLAVVGFVGGWWGMAQLGVSLGDSLPFSLNEAGLVVGLLSGLACALLAFVVHKWALGIAGFLLGGAGAALLIQVLQVNHGVDYGGIEYVGAVIAGILGSMALRRLFGGGLIVLSSILGSGLIVEGLGVRGDLALPALGVLAAVGFAAQYRSRGAKKDRRRRKRKRRKERTRDLLEDA